MRQLLSIEFIKLRKLRSLRVIFLMYFIMIPLLVYGVSYLITNFMGLLLPPDWSPLQFPDIWPIVAYSASYFNILMGVLAVIIIGNEFTYKTFRQHVIDGLSLKQAILSKFLVIFVFAIIITTYTFLTGLIYGVYNTSGDATFIDGISSIGYYFLQTLCYFSLAFFLTVLLKRTAVSIVLFVVLFLAETMVGIGLAFYNLKVVYAFFPLNAFSKLTPFPIFKELVEAGQEKSGHLPHILSTPVQLAVCIGYMTVFFLLSYWILKKRDL